MSGTSDKMSIAADAERATKPHASDQQKRHRLPVLRPPDRHDNTHLVAMSDATDGHCGPIGPLRDHAQFLVLAVP